jgi:hypothetical protein
VATSQGIDSVEIKKMKLLILGLASLALLALPEARASVVLDWGTVKQGPIDTIIGGPNGIYTTGSRFSDAKVAVVGSNFVPEGLRNPVVETAPYSVPVLSSVAVFKPGSGGTPTVTFKIDFFGFKQGVKDVSFDLFNVDGDHIPNKNLEDVVTFKSAGLTLVGSKDNVVKGNTVTGVGGSGFPPTGGPQSIVAVHSGNLPLHQIVFNWTESILPGNTLDFLEEIALGNITFTPVPEVGQLAVGLVACLLGAFWLHTHRRKRAHSIP